MHFDNASAALRYLHSPDGWVLTKLAHTQFMRAAKTDGTRDSWARTAHQRKKNFYMFVPRLMQ